MEQILFPIVGSKEKFQRDLILFHDYRAVEFIKFFVNFSRPGEDFLGFETVVFCSKRKY